MQFDRRKQFLECLRMMTSALFCPRISMSSLAVNSRVELNILELLPTFLKFAPTSHKFHRTELQEDAILIEVIHFWLFKHCNPQNILRAQ